MSLADTDNAALSPENELKDVTTPEGIDRRTFLMRTAVIGATCVITGRAMSAEEQTARATAAPPLGSTLSPDLNVVKASKGPVKILADEFYKVGPGP